MPPEVNPPADESSTIRQMRAELEAKNADLAAAKQLAEEKENKLKEIERAALNDAERLRLELQDKVKAEAELKQQLENEKVNKQALDITNQFLVKKFEDGIAALPEEKREAIKKLSFVEGNPVLSLERLEETVKLTGVGLTPAGSITNPGANTPPPGNLPPEKIDLKNLTWGQALRSLDEIKAGKKKGMQ